MSKKILQIIPAVGWKVLHFRPGGPRWSRLVCWALCEEDGKTFVAGIYAHASRVMRFCDETDRFECFASTEPGEELPTGIPVYE